MIFADKVISLRKKNGWSQEELADKIDVSRQAVSKWESAQAIPEIGKVLQLANLFGVTTDYLLKDELEEEEYAEDIQPIKSVSIEEASQYLDKQQQSSIRMALATFLCIFSIIPLLLLVATTEIPAAGISGELAIAIGIVAMLLIVGLAVGIFVYNSFANAPYEYLYKQPFELQYGVKGMVEERKKAFRSTYAKSNIIATVLCVLSPIALFATLVYNNGFFVIAMLCCTLIIAGIGVLLFVKVGVVQSSMCRLLREVGYVADKDSNARETISWIYWLVATAIYLAISLPTDNWDTSWIVWPIAGVLYVALMGLVSLIMSNKNK